MPEGEGRREGRVKEARDGASTTDHAIKKLLYRELNTGANAILCGPRNKMPKHYIVYGPDN